MEAKYSISRFYQQNIPQDWSKFLLILNSITALLTALLNSLLCFAILRMKLLSTISYRFILALSISDLFIAVIVQPLYSLEYSQLLSKTGMRRVFPILIELLATVFGMYSGIMVVIISFDRYLHMKFVNHYNFYMTIKRANFLIFGNIVLTCLTGALQTSAIFLGFYAQLKIGILLCNIVAFFIGVFFYSRAFLSVRRRVADLQVARSSSNIRRADFQFAKGVLLTFVLLTLCYIPYFVTGTFISMRIISARTSIEAKLHTTFHCTVTLVFMVPLINSVIFFMFNSKLKAYVYSLASILKQFD